jgi:hypothetical protein
VNCSECDYPLEHLLPSHEDGGCLYCPQCKTSFNLDGKSLTEKKDSINPDHYKSHPSGVECIQITEHMNFCVGNAIKYLWRAGLKGDAVKDLQKAKWYVEREIERLRTM